MPSRKYRVAVHIIARVCVDMIIFFLIALMLGFELFLDLPAHGHVRDSQGDAAGRVKCLLIEHDRSEVELADGVDPVHLTMIVVHFVLRNMHILTHRQLQVRSFLANDVVVLRE